MKKEILEVGFVGGGINSAVGEAHFIASQMDGFFQVVAGCFSTDPDVNRRTAERHHVSEERVYSSWEQLLASECEHLDAVVVLTPTPAHASVVIAALENGLAVISEKALAASSKEAEQIKRALETHNGRLFVTYNYSGYPMLRELRSMITRGVLGRIEQVHIEMPQEGFARLKRDGQPMIPQKWRLEDGSIPTISLDLGVHLHHIVDFLTGEHPQELVANQVSLGSYHDVIDNISALVRYTNGIECSMWYSKTALGYRNGLRVRVFGDQGAAEWYQMEPECLTLHDNFGHTSRVDRACVDVEQAQLPRYNRFKAGHPAGFLEAFANIYADIAAQLTGISLEDEHSVYSVHHALEGLRMLESIAISAHERRWVSLEQNES